MPTPQFYHHPDGFITISDNTNTLLITLAEFLTYEAAYALPGGAVAQNYIPLVKHILYDSAGKPSNGSLPDTTLDGYIANLSDYIDEHENPVKTLPEAKADKIFALQNYRETIKLGYVSLFSTTMPSHALDANALISYNEAAAVPMGFYLRDTDDAHVSLSLAQFNEYNDGVVQLHDLCRINYDTHEEAINALGSVAAVDAYDFTTGWPTVPYTPV